MRLSARSPILISLRLLLVAGVAVAASSDAKGASDIVGQIYDPEVPKYYTADNVQQLVNFNANYDTKMLHQKTQLQKLLMKVRREEAREYGKNAFGTTAERYRDVSVPYPATPQLPSIPQDPDKAARYSSKDEKAVESFRKQPDLSEEERINRRHASLQPKKQPDIQMNTPGPSSRSTPDDWGRNLRPRSSSGSSASSRDSLSSSTFSSQDSQSSKATSVSKDSSFEQSKVRFVDGTKESHALHPQGYYAYDGYKQAVHRRWMAGDRADYEYERGKNVLQRSQDVASQGVKKVTQSLRALAA